MERCWITTWADRDREETREVVVECRTLVLWSHKNQANPLSHRRQKTSSSKGKGRGHEV